MSLARYGTRMSFCGRLEVGERGANSVGEGGTVLERQDEGQVTVIRCVGDITTENFPAFKAEWRTLLAELSGCGRLVLDLGSVENIASAALGLIAASYPEFTKSGARMRLVARTDEVLRLLNVTRLSKVIRVDTDLNTAVQALK